MKTLSNSYKGNVYKTSEVGYSPKLIAKKIMKKVEKDGQLNSFNRARTGSIYLDFDLNGFSYTVRISNHNQRGHEINFFSKVEVNSVEYPDGEVINYVEFDMINSYGRDQLYKHLGI